MRKSLCGIATMLTACCLQAATPYATKIFDYCPAPGQFVNNMPEYSPGDTYETMLKKVSGFLTGNPGTGMISLGAWGGYVVIGFDHAIPNKPDTVDFKIYGNAYANSSEPGIVMVSKDENKNGLPDDAWYELAGSQYDSLSTDHAYRCVYYKPESLDADVIWKDNRGNTGCILRNKHHPQPYYPMWTDADSLCFEGSRLVSNAVVKSPGLYELPGFAWGYADNRPNQSLESCFDIDWARDAEGCPVKIDEIDFIKIYTAQQQSLGWLGETSTEVSGVEDLHCAKVTEKPFPSEKYYAYLTEESILYVQCDASCAISIYHCSGRCVYANTKTTGHSTTLEIDLSSLPSGMYIGRLAWPQGEKTIRMRIQ